MNGPHSRPYAAGFGPPENDLELAMTLPRRLFLKNGGIAIAAVGAGAERSCLAMGVRWT